MLYHGRGGMQSVCKLCLEADFCGGGTGATDVNLSVLRIGYFYSLQVEVAYFAFIIVHCDVVCAALADGDYRCLIIVPNLAGIVDGCAPQR